MIELGDSVYADKAATQEYVVTFIHDDGRVTAVAAESEFRTRDLGAWYAGDGQLRWKR